MTPDQKALNYYRAAAEGRRPDFVPARVRLKHDVRADPPFRNRAPQGEYDCQSNPYGAISVMASDGTQLGVKLAEFDVLTWRENPR